MKSQLMHPKEPTPDAKKCGVIYQLECADCGKEYIGATGRVFNTRNKEHINNTRATISEVGEHLKETGHKVGKHKHLRRGGQQTRNVKGGE